MPSPKKAWGTVDHDTLEEINDVVKQLDRCRERTEMLVSNPLY